MEQREIIINGAVNYLKFISKLLKFCKKDTIIMDMDMDMDMDIVLNTNELDLSSALRVPFAYQGLLASFSSLLWFYGP